MSYEKAWSISELKNIDAWEFCRKAGRVDGLSMNQNTSVETLFERLAQVLAGEVDHMVWNIRGDCDNNARCQVVLSGVFMATMHCHRCGEPIVCNIEFDRTLVLCKSEQAADSADALDDDEIDHVAASGKVDMLAWLEDEMLLSLPSFVRHDKCTPKVDLKYVAASDTPLKNCSTPDDLGITPPAKPFAVLAILKKTAH